MTLPERICRRCKGKGEWEGGADGGVWFKCDPCPASDPEEDENGVLILRSWGPKGTVHTKEEVRELIVILEAIAGASTDNMARESARTALEKWRAR